MHGRPSLPLSGGRDSGGGNISSGRTGGRWWNGMFAKADSRRMFRLLRLGERKVGRCWRQAAVVNNGCREGAVGLVLCVDFGSLFN